MTQAKHGEEWLEYYERFPYFSHEDIRDGCFPWKMVNEGSDRVIVLVHGLTDSPFFMMDLARFFYTRLGYSVFIPLLQCHGLKNPEGMEGVSLAEWKENVSFAVDRASRHGRLISIGGLSAGGALGLWAMENMEEVNGCLYLFSAALELAGGVIGSAKEKILRTSLVDVMEYFNRKRELVGEHPYRYAFMDMGGARELAVLIGEITEIIEGYSDDQPFNRWVFAAHTENDEVTGFGAIERLYARSVVEKFEFWRIAADNKVSHAGLVLANSIFSPDTDVKEPLERGNPIFSELLARLEHMEQRMFGDASSEDTLKQENIS